MELKDKVRETVAVKTLKGIDNIINSYSMLDDFCICMW